MIECIYCGPFEGPAGDHILSAHHRTIAEVERKRRRAEKAIEARRYKRSMT